MTTKARIRARILNNILALSALMQTAYFKQPASAQSLNIGSSTVYYDADEINLDKETGYLKAKGNAFFLLGNIFISADHVEYNQKQRIVIAEGGVRIVRSKERITASRVLINEATNEARMDDVEIYADPADTEAQVKEEVLGFSRAELAFEMARQQRANEIRQELMQLRTAYANLRFIERKSASTERLQMTRRYATLLERLVRTQFQPSDVLRDLPEDARLRLENRREAVRTFATRDPELAKKLAGLQKVPGYLSMRARRVFQNSNQNLDVEAASLTTCRCDPGDDPAWGLSAAHALVEPNEYITLYGSTLEVVSFPIVYSPWFKMPIKTKRQSGFLLPSFYLSRAGDAASVPYYLTLGESADSTLTLTYFSKRGPKAELEVRAALSEQSQTNLRGEILKQKAAEGQPAQQRWAWAAQSNLPLEQRTTFKFDLERASDQRYFSDITKEPGAAQDLFTPQLVVKRFLWQEAALEHSGEHFALTARAQKPQDVFLTRSENTTTRIPRVDFTLFPKNLGETALALEGKANYEKIEEKISTAEATTNGPRTGERTQSQLRLAYPLSQNRFVNLRLGGEFGFVKYRTQDFKGELNHPAFDLTSDVPLFTEFLNRKQATGDSRFRHVITPFASMRWVPVVNRSNNYPDIYSTFYASDNIARIQTLEFGFHTHLNFLRDEFRVQDRNDTQTTRSGGELSSPGRVAVVFKQLGIQPTPNNTEPNQQLYELTFQNKNTQSVFLNWAQEELDKYELELTEQRSDQSTEILTPKPSSWRRVNLISAQPIGFSARTSYNFEAMRTAREQNKNLQPGQTPVSADPWGDVSGTVSLSSQPWLPLNLNLTRIWKPAWNRFREQIATLDYNSSLGINVNLIRSRVLSELVDAQGNRTYPAEDLWGVDASYQPKAWVKIQAQYKRNIKPQPALSEELEYSTLQKITFLGIQDCLDITLQRFKDRDVMERMATWTIGLNLNFLGQQRPIESLGKVVDRAIKSQLNKGSALKAQ
jgi:lipopolysaccharide assembly outer membrane protein LptD (OstA)